MIFVLILVCYSLGLWRMSVPMTGDQKTYLSIALEMKEKGSILIPYLYGQPNFLKPPLQYWMTLIGWKLFGLSLFGALLPSVLALVASSWLVQKISKSTTPLPALVFASTLATMTYGTTAQMEIWIVAFYLAAWALYLEKKLLLTFVTVGVMAWVKGPLYPVLFVLSIFFKAYLDHNLIVLKKPKFLLSLLLGILVGLSWYFAAATTHYQALRDVFFGRENFGKLQTSQGTPWGLWGEFIMTLFPVVYLVIVSVADPEFKNRFKTHGKLWLSYALIPALFFTFFPYRVNTYLYLLTPVIAWMTVTHPHPSRPLKLLMSAFVVIIALVGGILSYRLWSGQWISLVIALSLAVTLTVWALANIRLNAIWVGVSSLILVNLIRFGATDIGEWDLRPLREVASASEFEYRIEPNQEDIWHEFGLISSALARSIHYVSTPEQEIEKLNLGETLLLSEDQFPLSNEVCSPWRRLKRRTKFPVYDLLFSGLSIEDPSLHRNFKFCRLRK